MTHNEMTDGTLYNVFASDGTWMGIGEKAELIALANDGVLYYPVEELVFEVAVKPKRRRAAR